MNYMDDAYEVALFLMGKDPDNDKDFEEGEDKIDDFLYEKYGIADPDKFSQLLHDLARIADKAKSELTNHIYSGFATTKDGHGLWLFKIRHEKNLHG